MVVIPNAVPANGFWPASPSERADARVRFGLPADSFVGAYIGALAEEKGVDLAVGTAADASVDTLLIVGDGPDRERLEQLSCGLPPGRVRFTGSLDKTIDVLHAVDVLLLPSRGGDSMPAVLIEAGLCSVPTVTTPVGAIEDVVVDGATGYVVPIGDQASFSSAVRSLAVSADTRSAFGASAQERCLQRFTIEATAPLWVTLLERAVRSRSRTGLSSFSQPHRA